MTLLRRTADGLLLAVRATPKSSRNAVTGLHRSSDDAVSLAVKVTAPPDKGKANLAVIETVARAAGVAKSGFSLASGETSRDKVLLVTGNYAAVEAWIATLERENGTDGTGD